MTPKKPRSALPLPHLSHPRSSVARTSVIDRKTAETEIHLGLTIEGAGRYKVSTGIRFFDHMLELFTRHGAFDLISPAKAISMSTSTTPSRMSALLSAKPFDKALGDKNGIFRAGYFLMPMDETLGVAAIDLSGRAACVVDTKSARAWSAISRANSSTISSRALPAAPAPTFTSKRCTAAPTITRSKLSSRPSPAHCAWPARATSNSARCCPARRACYDRGRRLQARKSHLGREGPRGSGR